MRVLCGALCFTALIAAASAQIPAQSPAAPQQQTAEVDTQATPFTFRSRVNVVLVPVVVRDKHGSPVSGLKKEDFQLFDKGKPQTIEKFAVEKSGGSSIPVIPLETSAIEASGAEKQPQSVTAAGNFIAYVFDDVHIDFADLARTRDAAWKHISTALSPSDRAAIYTTSGQVILDFTDDRDKLHDALIKLRPTAIARSAGTECPDVTFYIADLILNKNDRTAQQAEVQDAIACLNLSGSGAVQAATAAVQQKSQQVLSAGEHETQISFQVLRDYARRLGSMPGQRSMIFVSPGFIAPFDMLSQLSEVLDRAIRNNVVINVLDARGLYTGEPDASRRFNSDPALLSRYLRESMSADSDILNEIANGTGGEIVQNSNDYLSGFSKLATPPETWYVLGFSPQNLKLDGLYHALKVTLRERKDLAVKARKGYYAPRHLTDADEQAKQEIEEALFSRDEVSDIPISLHTQFFKPNRDQARLSVIARIDVRKLHYRKIDGRNSDEVKIITAVFDRNGNILEGLSKLLTMRLKDETLVGKLEAGVAIRSDFKLVPGTYIIRVVVRDAEGEMMAARNGAVEIPFN